MKILIPYDGSKNARFALRSLRDAGFTEKHEALIVISAVWLPESAEEFKNTLAERRRSAAMSGAFSFAPAMKIVDEERILARESRSMVLKMFPSWDVSVETLPGNSLVSSEILQRAESWKADLIVLGSQGAYTDNSVYGLGAVRVAAEAPCSVRIFRKTDSRESAPSRIMVALDGTGSDVETLKTVASRQWASGSKAHLFAPSERSAAESLQADNLAVSTKIMEDDSPSALIKEIRNLKADCIFISGKTNPGESAGLARHSADALKRMLRETLCSIEIVRPCKSNLKNSDFQTLERDNEIKSTSAAAASVAL